MLVNVRYPIIHDFLVMRYYKKLRALIMIEL